MKSKAQFSLSVSSVSKTYRGRWFDTLSRHTVSPALDGVSLDIHEDEIIAVIGESGSGKTTLARILLGLVEPTTGALLYNGIPLSQATRAERDSYRRDVQVIFQDPSASLNPRHRLHTILRYIIRAHKLVPRDQESHLIYESLIAVGLPGTPEFMQRYPHQLSGGQQQRVAIARSFLLGARLIVADEPLASLDASTKTQVLKLMLEKKQASGTSFFLVTHDLDLIGSVADRVVVMYQGSVVEQGDARQILETPSNPYTKSLLAAKLTVDPEKSRFRSYGA